MRAVFRFAESLMAVSATAMFFNGWLCGIPVAFAACISKNPVNPVIVMVTIFLKTTDFQCFTVLVL